MRATPETLRYVAQARADGRSWLEIARLPGMPAQRTLQRWDEAGIIPDLANTPILGTDVLLSLMTDPSTSQAVRAKCAADYERLRLLQAPEDGGAGPAVVHLQVRFPDDDAIRRWHADLLQREAEEQARAQCTAPHRHAILNGGSATRSCGCPA